MTLPSYNHQSHRLRKLFLVLEYEHQTTVGTQVLVQLARVAEAGGARKAGLFPSERYQLENRLNSILKRCEVIVLEIEKHERFKAEEDREREAYKKAAGRANERQKWRFARVRQAVSDYRRGRLVFEENVVAKYLANGSDAERGEGV